MNEHEYQWLWRTLLTLMTIWSVGTAPGVAAGLIPFGAFMWLFYSNECSYEEYCDWEREQIRQEQEK